MTEGFLMFAGIVVISVIFVASILSYTIFSSYRDSIKKDMEVTSKHIENILDDIFTESTRLMIFIGKQISHSEKVDLQKINELLKNTSGIEYKSKALLSWTLFDWVDPKCFQLINSAKGIHKSPIDLSNRSYCTKCRVNPWSLQFSNPTFGTPSGIWVIPAGVGITDEQHKFLGMITVGFNIAVLTSSLSQKLGGENISFIILDENLNPVLESKDNATLNSNTSNIGELIKANSNHFDKPGGSLTKPLEYNGIAYAFYNKMKNYPFFILTGIQDNLYTKGFRVLVLPPIIELFGMGLFFIMLLYVSKRRILKLSKIADKAKEDFIEKVNNKVQKQMDIIFNYSETLIRYIRGEIKIGINTDRQLEFLTNIRESALSIKNMTTENLDLSVVDINSAVTDAIYIHREIAFQKNISIKAELEPQLPLIHADDFCIRQIVISLLSSSIEYIPYGGNIWFSTKTIREQNQNKIMLTMRDNGFGLSEHDRIRINNKLFRNPHNSTNKTKITVDLDLGSIQKLIILHQGTFEVENIEGKGRLVTIQIPDDVLKR